MGKAATADAILRDDVRDGLAVPRRCLSRKRAAIGGIVRQAPTGIGLYGQFIGSADEAYVGNDIAGIAPCVVAEALVKDGQRVRAGNLAGPGTPRP